MKNDKYKYFEWGNRIRPSVHRVTVGVAPCRADMDITSVLFIPDILFTRNGNGFQVIHRDPFKEMRVILPLGYTLSIQELISRGFPIEMLNPIELARYRLDKRG